MNNLGDCIYFSGYKNKDGYGIVNRMVNGKARRIRAHRLAYAEVHGQIPEGMCVCHKCDCPSCINVNHLFLGTHSDNMQDRSAKGRANLPKGSNHCRARLTEQDIPRIRDMLAYGCAQKAIGEWFGVSQSIISDIKQGKIWTHVA